MVAKVIEHLSERYDVQEVPFGTVYKWLPESVLAECECGEMVTLTASESACEGCGAEHTGVFREDPTQRQSKGDEQVHPWRSSMNKGDDGTSLPY
jgi:hypothetical protein